MVELGPGGGGVGRWWLRQPEHSDLELELPQLHELLQDPAFGFNPVFILTARRHVNPHVV